jgi:Glycosyltransferase family 9 (heptosyltransferase)
MGLGDNLMATGLASGAAQRGKKIAFGDGRKIIWDKHSAPVFRNNPNVARPGSEGASNLEWRDFYAGHRIYNRRVGDRWEWNYEFRAVPGEVFFLRSEREFAERQHSGFILIEPSVPQFKSVAPNKTWPLHRYQELARRLMGAGFKVRQFEHRGGQKLEGVKAISAPTFRHALAALSRSAFYVGPEGGLHHGAAAVGIKAVVLFGGFIPPLVTGYNTHVNLTGGAEACGSLQRCAHCEAAMAAISVDEVEASCRSMMATSA